MGMQTLVVVWTYHTVVKVTEGTFERTTQAGWTVASSDHLGSLVPTRQVLLPGEDILILGIAGGDFDGDGLFDLAFSEGFRTLELWHNRGEDGFETILQLSDVFFAWPSRWRWRWRCGPVGRMSTTTITTC